MLYFIPAWYKEREWCENEQNWRVKRMQSEFDDTVKQIQLFHRSGGYDYRIMLLGFASNFRHFLHRQGVFRAPYWSCFDAIQEIRGKKAGVLSFHDLDWPEGIEFLYTPFVVVAMLGRSGSSCIRTIQSVGVTSLTTGDLLPAGLCMKTDSRCIKII